MQDRNLWDVSMAPTIVMTQQGVRSDFQVHLFLHALTFVAQLAHMLYTLYQPHLHSRTPL